VYRQIVWNEWTPRVLCHGTRYLHSRYWRWPLSLKTRAFRFFSGIFEVLTLMGPNVATLWDIYTPWWRHYYDNPTRRKPITQRPRMKTPFNAGTDTEKLHLSSSWIRGKFAFFCKINWASLQQYWGFGSLVGVTHSLGQIYPTFRKDAVPSSSFSDSFVDGQRRPKDRLLRSSDLMRKKFFCTVTSFVWLSGVAGIAQSV
jgi:hypothetical protein